MKRTIILTFLLALISGLALAGGPSDRVASPPPQFTIHNGVIVPVDSTKPLAIGTIGLKTEIIAPTNLYAVAGVTPTNVRFDNLIAEVAGSSLLNWDVVPADTGTTQYNKYWTHDQTNTTHDGTTVTFSTYDTAGNVLDSHAFMLNVAADTAGSAAGYGTSRLESDPPDFDTAPVWTASAATAVDQTLTPTGAATGLVYRNVGMVQGRIYRLIFSATATANEQYRICDAAGESILSSGVVSGGVVNVDVTKPWTSSNVNMALWYYGDNPNSMTVVNWSVTPVIPILYIGDSTVAGHEIIDHLQEFDKADSGVSLAMIGTQDLGGDNNEGYSGQTLNWFYTDAASPFYNVAGFSTGYSSYCDTNGTPGYVVIQLGINELYALTTDAAVASLAATSITQLDAMVTGMLAKNAYTKVGLVLVFGPSDQDDMGTSYGAGQNAWRLKRNFQLYNKALIAHSWDAAVSLIPANLQLDTENNMANGVHPSNTVGASGYEDIAVAVYAWLKNIIE